MALEKRIRQEDGVVTNYHRILFVNSVVNSHISIAVLSYVDKEIRTKEKEGVIVSPYRKSTTYEIEYIDNMTIDNAYEYLKTLSDFKNAINE